MEIALAGAALIGTDEFPARGKGLAELDRLAEQVEQAVRRETGYSVRDLTVEITREGILLKGRCESFYCKQMAQHAAMNTPGADRLINAIEVG